MYDELDELIVVDQVVVNAVLLKIFQMVQNRLDDKGVQYHVDDIETVFNRCFGQDKYSFVHDLFMTGLTQAADAICDYGLCNEIYQHQMLKRSESYLSFLNCVIVTMVVTMIYFAKCLVKIEDTNYGLCGHFHLMMYLYLFHIAQMMS